jgi:hypothetical protein
MKEKLQTTSTDSRFVLAVTGVPAVEATYRGSRFLIAFRKKAEMPWTFQDEIDTITQKSFGGLKETLGELGMSLKFAGSIGTGARSLELTVSEAAMAKYGTEGVAQFVSQERVDEINADVNAATVLNDPPAETVAEPVAETVETPAVEAADDPFADLGETPVKAKKVRKAKAAKKSKPAKIAKVKKAKKTKAA